MYGFDVSSNDDFRPLVDVGRHEPTGFSEIEGFSFDFSASDTIRGSSFYNSKQKPPARVVPSYTYYSSNAWQDPGFRRLSPGRYGKRYCPPSTAWGKTYVPLREELRLYCKSLPSFYAWDNALNFGVALAVAAPLANTSVDWDFRSWYQDDVRSTESDDFASACKTFGEGAQMLPLIIGLGMAYRYLKVDCGWEQKQFDLTGEWASRSARAVFVGFPTLLVGQVVLGSGRPDDGPDASYWDPFKSSHGISGHAFIGAIPFITAAQMTDRVWLKTIFYGGSMLTGWSRINDDAHFLSQVILGWYLAYLSCRSISRIENPHFGRGLTVFPVLDSRMSGLGVMYRY